MWLALHLLIVAGLAGAVEAACRLARPRPAVCHLLWLVVLVKLMTPPVVSWPWALPDAGGLERLAVLDFVAVPSEGPAATPGESASGKTAAPAAAAAPRQPAAIDLWSTGMFLWTLGAVCAAVLQGFRLRTLRRMSRGGIPAPDWMERLAGEMARRLDVRPPRVLLVEGLCSAVAFSAWRPSVLVSRGLIDAIPRGDFAGILAHELAHLKRRDLWSGLLEFAAQCVWWWYPLLYVVRRRLHLYREMAADAWALSVLPQGRRYYAETLVRVVDLASRRPAPMAAFGMAGGPAATFERRLAMVLDAASPCRLPRVTLAATLVLLALVAPGWSVARQETDSPAVIVDEAPASETVCGEPALVAELRAWYVVSDLEGQLGERMGGEPDVTGHEFLGIATNPMTAGELVVGGKSVIMQGSELRWGENEEPTGDDVGQVFSAMVGLRADEKTAVKTSLPTAEFEVILQPELDGLVAWLTTTQTGGEPLASSLSTRIFLESPRKQWQALFVEIGTPEGKRAGTFMLFWKVQPATAELVARVETGDTDDCKIAYSAAEPFKGIYATADLKIIEVARTEYERVAEALKPLKSETGKIIEVARTEYERVAEALKPLKSETGNSGAAVYHLQSPQTVMDLLPLDDMSRADLLSAPRVTFPVAIPPTRVKILQRREDQNNYAFEILKASETLEEFVGDASPTAVIADTYLEAFKDRSGNIIRMHEGMIAAIAAKQDEGADTVSVRVLVDDVRLKRHQRGLAFWKPRRLPDVLSNPVEVAFTCAFGGTVVFEAPTQKSGKHRLILLTIDKAEHS